MRVYTLALSVVTHLLAVAAVVMIPLYATDVLPEPYRAVEFVRVVPVIPDPPPVLRPREQQTEIPPAHTTPLTEPVGLQPEVDAPPPEPFDLPTSMVDGEAFAGTPVDAEPVPPPPPARKPVRLGGAITRPERIRDVPPVYPALARASSIQGTVIIEAVIGVDGTVQDARALRPIPFLTEAALDAVRQWLFTPTMLNGEPVPVVMTVTVTFRLR